MTGEISLQNDVEPTLDAEQLAQLFAENLDLLSSTPDPEHVENARTVVLGGELPPTLTVHELGARAVAWQNHFLSSVETAGPEEISTRVEAFKVLMDVDAHLDREASQLDLVIKRAGLIATTMARLLDQGPVLHGARALLAYLDTEIGSVSGHPDNTTTSDLLYLRELRSKYARQIPKDYHIPNSP